MAPSYDPIISKVLWTTVFKKWNPSDIILLNPNNMYIICIKDLVSISGAKFHYIFSTVKLIIHLN